MYSKEDFDNAKTKILKYILYKKRTEQEIRQKFVDIDENIVEDAIEYLKEAGYINDLEYIDRAINEFIALNTLSIKEIKYKLQQKGISKSDIEEYVQNNYERIYEYEKQSALKIYEKKKNIDYLYKKGYNEEVIKEVDEYGNTTY